MSGRARRYNKALSGTCGRIRMVCGMYGKRSIRIGKAMKTAAVLTAALLLCGAAVMSDRLSAKAAGEMEDSRKIAITFDDGPHPYYTEQLLDGLKERGVKATFFVTGMHAEQYPELICRMSDEGD